eukprot:3216799-Rhodomonas_salina.4
MSGTDAARCAMPGDFDAVAPQPAHCAHGSHLVPRDIQPARYLSMPTPLSPTSALRKARYLSMLALCKARYLPTPVLRKDRYPLHVSYAKPSTDILREDRYPPTRALRKAQC